MLKQALASGINIFVHFKTAEFDTHFCCYIALLYRIGGSTCRGARAVRARCGYWGCSVDPFIQNQSGGMRAQCARGADTPPWWVGLEGFLFGGLYKVCTQCA